MNPRLTERDDPRVFGARAQVVSAFAFLFAGQPGPSQDHDMTKVYALQPGLNDPAFWAPIRFVVFDVDGTLYRQRPLRWIMARELIWDAVRGGGTLPVRVLHRYRKRREQLAESETSYSEATVQSGVAAVCGATPAVVGGIVEEWMHRRPLRHLKACAVAGVQDVFRRIRISGRRIGVLSDYPAERKLEALGLAADFVVDANHRAVNRLKPHPAGLQLLMQQAEVRPEETLLLGDRGNRDGEAARRAGVRFLLRTDAIDQGQTAFMTYMHPPFTEISGLLWS